ncbi:MAG: PrsW family intramembrane metalloprotease [Phycisphaeraceae bacterium]|nr:PrsW family intramembrane metalloprotease [Phycisphaeraceae bacterium]
MLVYAMLAVSALVIAVIVYRYDLYDREPWWLLVVATALGAAGMWVAGRVQVMLISAAGSLAAEHFDTAMALVAATTEEANKILGVAVVAVCFRRWFNDPLDGLVYGSFAGLGAAILESVGVVSEAAHEGVLPAHEVVRLAGHLVMGGIAGFGLGLWPFRRRGWNGRHGPLPWVWAAAGCFLAAWTLHFLWDLVAFAAERRGRMTPMLTACAMTMMLGGLLLFRGLVGIGAARSRAVFAVK